MITDFVEIAWGHKPNIWPRQELKLDLSEQNTLKKNVIQI